MTEGARAVAGAMERCDEAEQLGQSQVDEMRMQAHGIRAGRTVEGCGHTLNTNRTRGWGLCRSRGVIKGAGETRSTGYKGYMSG